MLRINSTSPLKPLIKANQCNLTIQGIQPINLDRTLAAKGRIDVSQTICNSIYKLKIQMTDDFVQITDTSSNKIDFFNTFNSKIDLKM